MKAHAHGLTLSYLLSASIIKSGLMEEDKSRTLIDFGNLIDCHRRFIELANEDTESLINILNRIGDFYGRYDKFRRSAGSYF